MLGAVGCKFSQVASLAETGFHRCSREILFNLAENSLWSPFLENFQAVGLLLIKERLYRTCLLSKFAVFIRTYFSDCFWSTLHEFYWLQSFKGISQTEKSTFINNKYARMTWRVWKLCFKLTMTETTSHLSFTEVALEVFWKQSIR